MKVSKEVDFALRQYAERLPCTENAPRKPQMGAQLLRKRPGLRDSHGKPLNPAQRYFVSSPATAANHLRRLRLAYIGGSMAAVVAYLLPFQALLEVEEPAPTPPAPRAAEGFPCGADIHATIYPAQ